MQGMMGIVTDALGKPLVYDHTRENFTIRDGIIACKNKKVHDVTRERIVSKLGKSIGELHK